MFTKVNGKDVLWSTYTLRFTNSEKLFQDCNSADEELFRTYKVNDLHKNLNERIVVVENISDLFHSMLPFESYLSIK